MAQKIDLTIERYTGILASSRDVLIDALDKMIAEATEQGIIVVGPYLRIIAPCGHEFTIQTADDVPYESLPCTCGNPQHWFIKYEELYQEVHKN